MAARHEDLKIFQLADRLALDVFKMSAALPPEERDGLRPHLRRAAIAVPIGIIEGCVRSVPSEREQMVATALGAASEMRYLLSVLHRLDLIDGGDFDQLNGDYDLLVRGLQKFASARRDGDGAGRPRRDERRDGDGAERSRRDERREDSGAERDGDRSREQSGYGDDRRGPPSRRRDSGWRR